VGSFTSISLDPPLVGFFPDKRSSSWPRIAATGRFCVNVLGADQLDLCRHFASRADDKFAELAHGHSPSGLPLLDNALAWIDCSDRARGRRGRSFSGGRRGGSAGCGMGGTLLFFRGQYHDAVEIAQGV
jgi:hypothetical protein